VAEHRDFNLRHVCLDLQPKKVPSECLVQSHNSNETFFSYECSLGRTLELGQNVKVLLELDTSSLYVGSQQDIWINVEAKTASDTLGPSFTQVILPLVANADITIIGDQSINVFNPSTLLPATYFHQTFEVTLYFF
jgi:hypothetical protein